MVKERNSQLLETWLLGSVKMSGISDLVTFAQGLEKEGSGVNPFYRFWLTFDDERTRKRNRSKFARPYMPRFTNLRRLMWPSTGP